MQLENAIDTFICELSVERDLATKTIQSYRNRLQSLIDFVGSPTKLIVTALNPKGITDYLTWLKKQSLAEATHYAKRQIFGQFLQWAVEKKLIETAPKIRTKHPAPPPVTCLSPQEAQQMIATARFGTNHLGILHLRDQATFAVLGNTSLSIAQLSKLTVSDYDPENLCLRVGGLFAPLNQQICASVNLYLEGRRMLGIQSNWLFASRETQQWQPYDVKTSIERHRAHSGSVPLAPETPALPRLWPDGERLRFLHTPPAPYSRNTERTLLIIILGLQCGLRREEIATLKAQDIDLYRKTISVLGKGRKRREIPLNEVVLAILKPIVRERLPDQTVVLGDDEQPVSPKQSVRLYRL